MTGTPVGVSGDVLRDGVEAPSRDVPDQFFSRGALLPPLLGSPRDGTRVKVWFSGVESFSITFGQFGHESNIWTTEKGLAALIGDLQATLVRMRIARGDD